jgi:hypothetical protein
MTRGAKRGQRRGEVGHGPPGRRLEIGLGQDQHVGDLHDPGLEELEHVPGRGLYDDRHRVGHVGDLDLGLTHAHVLDHDHVKRRGQRGGGAARRRGQTAEPVAGGGRADEHLAVARVDVDPRPVAEETPAGSA